MNRRAPIFVLAGAVALAAVFAALVVLPKVSEVGERKDALAQEQQREQELLLRLDLLRDARDRAREVQRELKRLERAVPPTVDQQGLLLQLNNISIESNVDWMTVSPGAPTAVSGASFSIIPLSVVVAGGFFAVDEFLFRLETLPRQIKVTQLSVSAGGTADSELQVTFTAEAYTTDSSAGPGSVPGATGAVAPPPTDAAPATEG